MKILIIEKMHPCLQVCEDRQALTRIAGLYKHFLQILHSPPQPAEVTFMIYHVLLAAMTAASGAKVAVSSVIERHEGDGAKVAVSSVPLQ